VTLLPLEVSGEVCDAMASGIGVVALESMIISHGLPTDTAAATAHDIEQAVRAQGAVPATVAVLDGRVRIGLDQDALVRVAEATGVVKASIRDLGVVVSRGLTGATTVAATSYLANRAGIRVFATGGLGGVHRGAHNTFDESADLPALGSIPVTVVCSGVKSILDVPATLERLETLSVPVLGWRTDLFPGFYIGDTGLPVPWRVESAAEVAALMRARADLGPTARQTHVARQTTCDLRRLRAHGLITRIPHSHRYQLTDTGLHHALFLTRAHDRLLRTGLAQLTDPATHPLATASRAYQRALDTLAAQSGLAA
jgi:pseudouridine-5'-phosphate glycosidase